MNSQKGVAHILVLVILVVGLVVGLYLVQHPQIFKPRAFDKFGGGSISRPISGPIVCKEGLNSFAVESQCDWFTFGGVSFQCHDGSQFVAGNVGVGTTVTVGLPFTGNIGIGTSIGIVTSGNVGIGTTVLNLSSDCRTSPDWSDLAKEVCDNRSNCPVYATPPR